MSQEGEISEILTENIENIKTFCHGFFEFIFSNVSGMPLSIRMCLKIIIDEIRERFPGSEMEAHNILGNLVFTKWIAPKLVN